MHFYLLMLNKTFIMNNTFLLLPLRFRILAQVPLVIIKEPVKLVLDLKDIVVCVTRDTRVRTAKLVRKYSSGNFLFIFIFIFIFNIAPKLNLSPQVLFRSKHFL